METENNLRGTGHKRRKSRPPRWQSAPAHHTFQSSQPDDLVTAADSLAAALSDRYGFRIHGGKFYFTLGDRQSDVWMTEIVGSP